MRNQEIDITVITVNYNGLNDTCEFLDSWYNNIKSCSFEIIVIDNGSRNNESKLLKEKYPEIISIRSDKNIGFAGANNIGIEKAKGKFLFFLNNDIIIIEDNIDKLITKLSSSSSIGALSPLIRDNNNERTIQFAGFTKLSSITLRNHTIGEGCTDSSLFPSSPIPYLHGAAMLCKKEAVDKIGYMDTDYFLYYEELDWCEKFHKHGYELWYDPDFELIHKNSSSTGQDSPLKIYYLSRNRLLFA